MANEAYISAINADGLIQPALAAAVYEATESSMFLSGEIIPIVNAPGGIARVPEIATSVDVDQISSEASTGVDLENELATVTKNDIVCDLFAVRSVVRDLGGIDPTAIGTALGRAVAEKFDASVYAALDSAGDTTFDSTPLTIDDILDAAAVIRGNGEMGQLYAVFNTTQAYTILKEIGTNAFAGGDFQTQALRSGNLGNIGGVQCFMSHLITTQVSGETVPGYMFGADSMRIAMQKNVDIEVARRAAAVGNDVVASLHAKAALIDANRAIRLVDTTS